MKIHKISAELLSIEQIWRLQDRIERRRTKAHLRMSQVSRQKDRGVYRAYLWRDNRIWLALQREYRLRLSCTTADKPYDVARLWHGRPCA